MGISEKHPPLLGLMQFKKFKTRLIEAVAIPFKETGAGDAVAAVAQPIAERIDAAQGTQLAKCGGCAASKRELNFEAEKGGTVV